MQARVEECHQHDDLERGGRLHTKSGLFLEVSGGISVSKNSSCYLE